MTKTTAAVISGTCYGFNVKLIVKSILTLFSCLHIFESRDHDEYYMNSACSRLHCCRRMIIRYLIISFLLIQVAFKSFSQEAIKDSLSKAPDSTSSNWSFSAAAYYYILPHEKNTTTLLGMLIISFKEFKYSTPKVSIDSRLAIFPGITDWGRIRMGFNLSSKYEIFKDFNVGLNFYDEFDSRPPAGALSKNDFGLNFTIGYEFGK